MKYIYLVFMMTLVFSCEKNKIEIGNNDYLIFGHFYGFCAGDDCVQTYKLTSTDLFKDYKDRFKDTVPDFRPMEKDKFEQVKGIMDSFPIRLLDSEKTIIGCPDCADQGGLRIELFKKGKLQSWKIDQSKNAVPKYLHDFMDTINNAIGLIND